MTAIVFTESIYYDDASNQLTAFISFKLFTEKISNRVRGMPLVSKTKYNKPIITDCVSNVMRENLCINPLRSSAFSSALLAGSNGIDNEIIVCRLCVDIRPSE